MKRVFSMTQDEEKEALDRVFMQRAIDLSMEKMQSGAGGPFGAVIVKDGVILSEGWNEVASTHDPSAHAEVVAIRRACAALGTHELTGATLYTSCEPCPMCLATSYWARLSRIVFANQRDDAARIGFDDAFLYAEIPKTLKERLIPTEHLDGTDAFKAFEAWAAKADKVRY
jgi:guanine deaminase